MNITVKIPPQRLADMMIGAVEHNHMTRSWCKGIYLLEPVKGDEYPEYDDGHGKSSIWYGDPKLYDSGFLIEVHEIDDESTGHITKHQVDATKFAEGLAKMAAKSGGHFGDMLNENDDNITQDVFLQYIVLGEVVYG